MKHSDACVALIKRFEGCRLTVERDTNGTPVAGYGHDDPDLTVGAAITQAMADSFLAVDLTGVENFLNRVITRTDLTQAQFDALCDFVYNTGPEVLERSKLLTLINAGEDRAAGDDLNNFVHDSTGALLPGLVTRRAAERRMYLGV